MMNEKTINEQYAYIRTLLEEKKTQGGLDAAGIVALAMSRLGFTYPSGTIADFLQVYVGIHETGSQRSRAVEPIPKVGGGHMEYCRPVTPTHAGQRFIKILSRSTSYTRTGRFGRIWPKKILHILESFNDDLAISGLLSDAKMDEVLQRHENTLKFMFVRTWTNSSWTSEDEEDAKSMLGSELLLPDDLCLFVSAVTLSVMECFDLRKIMWLLDAYRHKDVNVSQRALVGVIFIFYIHRTRLLYYPELIKRVDLMDEIPSFREDVARIYRQMLLCQETEKIDKKMREEIIPEMLKNVSSMKNIRFGFEENDEENDDKNPDWEDAFEQSGLGDKLREMNELQLEGADVYMSTFSSLKSYPFFREVQNWFYPFSKQQSNVLKALKQVGNEGSSLLDLILQSGFFSNSDKYSLFFTIHQLPKMQQEMMLSQLNEQQVAELAEKSNAETMKKFNARPGTASNQYLHDLYRFFKLSVRRNEFRDIFKEKTRPSSCSRTRQSTIL